MNVSKTGICNLAVSWLGGRHITSVDNDDSFEARLCRANYDLSRTAVLEEREWTFAVKRIILAPLAAEPTFGFTYQFAIPADMLRSIEVYDLNDQGIQHLLEDNKIMCDEPTIQLKYLSNEETTTRFSSLFVQAFAAHISSNIALALTKDKTLQKNMYAVYIDKLQRAISTDSLQGSREMLKRSQLEKSRRHFVRER